MAGRLQGSKDFASRLCESGKVLQEGTGDVVFGGKLTSVVTWKRRKCILGDLGTWRISVTVPVDLQRNDPKNETVS